MTLLQPTDVPSRSGINNAITSEDQAHVDSLHDDTGWLTLPGTPAASLTGVTKQYRVFMGMGQIRFTGTLATTSVPVTGNINDIHVGDLPAGARPGGGGIASSMVVPIEIAQWVAYAYIYNGGSVNIAFADARGVVYDIGGAVSCISPLFTINS